MSFLKAKEPKKKDKRFFYVVHYLVMVLSELTAGTIQFQDVLGITRTPNFAEFKAFL